MSLATIDRYWHTLRHLRPRQITARLRYRLWPERPRITAPMSVRLGDSKAEWVVRPSSIVGPSEFRFLGEVRSISGPDAWSDPATPLLWLYNLHYFDVLGSEAAAADPEALTRLIGRWIAENPPGAKPGWDPYPLSLRIVNWIKAHLSGLKLDSSALASLSMQAQWLRSRLEWHLLGNHIIANAKALWFAAHFFVGDEADDLLQHALRILEQELDEQVPTDGFHFELSPMYHAIIQEDVLDMIAIAGARPVEAAACMLDRLILAAERMTRALPVMTHPDGGHAFFNDAALDISASCRELESYARRVLGGGFETYVISSPSVTHLSDAGYVRAQNGDAVVIFDAAAVGPDYIPGHAHADTLSLELSLGHERIIVNGGTSRYGLGDERLRQRGTAAHNTVVVDGRNSSEVWSGFRVARRARPIGLEIDQSKDACMVSCGHDGYRRLAGRPVHRRSWRLDKTGLTVEDTLGSTERHHAVAHYLLQSDVRIIDRSDSELRLGLPSGRAIRFRALEGGLAVAEGIWAPRFGSTIPTTCISVALSNGRASVAFGW